MITPMKKKRFFAEVTIYDLAIKTGIDPGRISLIERKYKTPREDEKEKIAEALGVDVEKLFSREEK
jgi:transcriptional regulator with XRE-family HTH domain